MLGLNDQAVFHLARYKAAFSADYMRWSKGKAKKPLGSNLKPTSQTAVP